MTIFAVNNIAWDKVNGLLPVIVQDVNTGTVLMHAYMNREALEATLTTKWVTFYSRSKQRLWMKGETSGNRLQLKQIFTDCDQDVLLILADPINETCHLGTSSCFGKDNITTWNFIANLEKIIAQRESDRPAGHYTTSLFDSGLNRIAQKVGEEAVEVVIAALENDNATLSNEAADLVFHLLVLLQAKKLDFATIIDVLKSRA